MAPLSKDYVGGWCNPVSLPICSLCFAYSLLIMIKEVYVCVCVYQGGWGEGRLDALQGRLLHQPVVLQYPPSPPPSPPLLFSSPLLLFRSSSLMLSHELGMDAQGHRETLPAGITVPACLVHTHTLHARAHTHNFPPTFAPTLSNQNSAPPPQCNWGGGGGGVIEGEGGGGGEENSTALLSGPLALYTHTQWHSTLGCQCHGGIIVRSMSSGVCSS